MIVRLIACLLASLLALTACRPEEGRRPAGEDRAAAAVISPAAASPAVQARPAVGGARLPCDPEMYPCSVDRSNAVVLAADGSGDARTLAAAIRLLRGERRTIVVRPGAYRPEGSNAEFLHGTCSAERPCGLVAEDPARPPVFDWGVDAWTRTGNAPKTGLIVAGPWWLLEGLVLQHAEYPIYVDAPHVTVRRSTVRRSAYDGLMVSRRHGGYLRVAGNRFEEIGTAFPSRLNTTPRHAIYYNAGEAVRGAVVVDNDMQWCTGAAIQMKAEEAFLAGVEDAGIYGLEFENNVALNCKDGLNFYFGIFGGNFAWNSFVFTADPRDRRAYGIVHEPVWIQLRSSGANRIAHNLVYYDDPAAKLVIGYQTRPADPANETNVFESNLIAVRGNGGRYGWNQRGPGMNAPLPFRDFPYQNGGRILATGDLDLPPWGLATPQGIRGLLAEVGAGSTEG